MKIGVNNNRTMSITQENNTIKVTTGTAGNIDDSFNISEGDFVMLMNYYAYTKDNNIQCEFINPNGR